MTIMLDLTDDEAKALATVIRRFAPEDAGRLEIDPTPQFCAAWYAAIDKLSPQLPSVPSETAPGGAEAIHC